MGWANVEEEQELDYYSADDLPISGDDNQQAQGVEVEVEAVQLQSSNGDEGEDSDLDNDIAHTQGHKTTSQRRRVQNDILAEYAANITSHIMQREVDEAASKGANEEQLSIRDILAKQETAVRITNPRDYQTELFQRAKSGNIIAVLDTGSGKTHIATLLLKHVLDEELESRAKGGTHKTAFFLVSTARFLAFLTDVA
jgi:endoribonuclease Dicer